MARITIVPEDEVVLVDGVSRTISMVGMNSNIHAVQWFGADGEIEYLTPLVGGPRNGRLNEKINSIAQFQVFIDRWTAAAPPSPPPPPLKSAADLTSKEFEQLLVDRAVVTRDEIDAIKAAR